MRPSVQLRTQDGTVFELGHGDLIGRLWSAAMHLDDPWISEAHALVSLRGDALHLLALRGRLVVGDQVKDEVRLDPGVRVALTPQVTVEVVAVGLPGEVLALEAEGLGRRVLHGTCGLVSRPRPAIVPLSHDGLEATVWRVASGWRVRLAGEEARALLPGDALRVGGTVFTAVEVAVAPVAATRRHEAVEPRLRVVARYDSVHVFREGAPPWTLGGVPARLTSELVRFAVPVSWSMLAGELWPDGTHDPVAQRKRLDAALSRLRARLAEGGVRPDLVRFTGAGAIELFLHDGDTVEDLT